jgi:hypothetical protein
LQNIADGGGNCTPAGLLFSEALASRSGDFVEACASLVFRDHPFRFDPAGFLHAMEGGVPLNIICAPQLRQLSKDDHVRVDRLLRHHRRLAATRRGIEVG